MAHLKNFGVMAKRPLLENRSMENETMKPYRMYGMIGLTRQEVGCFGGAWRIRDVTNGDAQKSRTTTTENGKRLYAVALGIEREATHRARQETE